MLSNYCNLRDNFKPRQFLYCNRFDQSIARQRLSKHFQTCNNIRKTVFSMWSAPSNNRNWVLSDQLLGYATVLTKELFSVWSVPRLFNEIPRITETVESELELAEHSSAGRSEFSAVQFN
jgi:hypothetical protein